MLEIYGKIKEYKKNLITNFLLILLSTLIHEESKTRVCNLLVEVIIKLLF